MKNKPIVTIIVSFAIRSTKHCMHCSTTWSWW